MTRLLTILFVIFAFAWAVNAQDCPHPSGCVTISRDAAVKALADSDRVAALEAEVQVKDAAIASFRDELNTMRIEFARVSGEATGLRTAAARDAAIIELLLKYSKKKCLPLSICF
jgi:hypothetical protein